MALASKQIAEQHLVLTAIGQDKTGLVSELTGLVSECRCNVVDSKMAIFGNEFTMIMLLAGDSASLVQLEMQLPQLAMKLNLLTMMKRTAKHLELSVDNLQVTLEGPDRAGTIKTITSFFAQNNVDISSLKSNTSIQNEQEWQIAEIVISLPSELSIEKLDLGLSDVCKTLNMTATINPITIDSK